MRLFLAISFPPAIRREFLAVQSRLRVCGYAGNFTKEENLHVTLAFLGEIPAPRLPAIRRAMEQTPVTPFPLSFDHAGCFKQTGGELWWIGAEGQPALFRLQRELCHQLRREGFVLEERRFLPHLTLARQYQAARPVNPRRLLSTPIEAQVSQIHLMRSDRPGGRLTYTVLFSHPPR